MALAGIDKNGQAVVGNMNLGEGLTELAAHVSWLKSMNTNFASGNAEVATVLQRMSDIVTTLNGPALQAEESALESLEAVAAGAGKVTVTKATDNPVTE